MYMQSKTFNISLPEELVKRTDIAARKAYKNRSEYIRDALINQLKEESDWDEIFAWGKEAGKKMGIKSEQDVYDMMYEFRHGRKPTSKSRA